MRFRDVTGRLPGSGRIFGTPRRDSDVLSPSRVEAGAWPVSPTEQVVLEVPALRARRLVRLQVAESVSRGYRRGVDAAPVEEGAWRAH